MAFDVSLGLGSVAGALASMWNVNQQNKMNQQNLDFSRESATTAFERQKELMNMQNEYNDPAAQMQRYVDAGLNPNLVYGTPNLSAAPSSVSTGQLGNSVAPQVDPLLASQVANIAADTKLKQSESDMTLAKAEEILGKTPLARADINKLVAETNLINQQYNMQSYKEGVELLKKDWFDSEKTFSYMYKANEDDENSWKVVSSTLKDYTSWQIQKGMQMDYMEMEAFTATFFEKIGLIKADRKYKDYVNDDMKHWLDVAEKIYNAQGSQADMMATVATLDKEFYDSLDSGPEGLKYLFMFVKMVMSAISAVPTGPKSK